MSVPTVGKYREVRCPAGGSTVVRELVVHSVTPIGGGLNHTVVFSYVDDPDHKISVTARDFDPAVYVLVQELPAVDPSPAPSA